jgi:hypothetical protein
LYNSNVINSREQNFQQKNNVDILASSSRPKESEYELSNASIKNHDYGINNSFADDTQANWQQAHLFEKEQLKFQQQQWQEEKRQHEFEKQQLNFEKKQKQADINKSTEEAQKYKDIAQSYKRKAAQSLALSQEYKIRAKEFLAKAQLASQQCNLINF